MFFNRKYILLHILLLFYTTVLFSQERQDSTKNLINIADNAFLQGNYYGAAKIYKLALKKTPNLYNVMYKCAESYRLDNNFPKAKNLYYRVLRHSFKRFPLSLYWLAYCQKSLGQYQQAQKHFSEYYEKHKLIDDFYTKRAKNEILSCEIALYIKWEPKAVNVEHLDTNINSYYSEFGVSAITDSILFFSSIVPVDTSIEKQELSENTEDPWLVENNNTTINKSVILQSTFNIKDWNTKEIVDKIINKKDYNVSNPSFTSDKKMMFFSMFHIDSTITSSKIYYSKLVNNKWIEPKALPAYINVPSTITTQASVAQTSKGDLLLFISNRLGGQGGLDIWYAQIKKNGTFGKPMNLKSKPKDYDPDLDYLMKQGPTVNSIADDICPFYNPTDSTLYFSTEWYNGLGGFDIFKTKGDFFSWEKPTNIGYPINSSNNDLYYTIDSKGKYAYLSSNRKESLSIKHTSCCNDIYRYELPYKQTKEDSLQVVVDIHKKDINLLVPLTLFFHNDQPNPNTTDTITNINYTSTYNEYLKLIPNYEKAYSKGVSSAFKEQAKDEINIFFTDEVKKGYKKLLDFCQLMEKLLIEKQQIIITLKGYSSPLNTTEYNENLAKRRIYSLLNFFHQYKDGIFNDYEKSGLLIYNRIAFGETSASKKVSSSRKDIRNSIYSPMAAKERRIQIIAISVSE